MKCFKLALLSTLVLVEACTSVNQTRTKSFFASGVILPKMDSIVAVVGKSDSLVLPFQGPKDWSKLVWFTQVGTAIRIKSYDLYSADTTENSTYNKWYLVVRYVGKTRGWSYLTFEPDEFPIGSTMITFSVTKPPGKVTVW